MSLKEGAGNKRPTQSRGRQKIPIAYITDPNKRHVTFSKRRVGLFKKAAELCALSGSHIAILAFTEAKKAFSFGHPNVDTVLQRYHHDLSGGHQAVVEETKPLSIVPVTSSDHIDDQFARTVHTYNQRYQHVMKQIEDEKKKSVDDHWLITAAKKADTEGNDNEGDDKSGFWWEKSVDGLELDELEQYMVCLQELKNNVSLKADQLAMSKATSVSAAASSGSSLFPSLMNGSNHDFESKVPPAVMAEDVNHHRRHPIGFEYGSSTWRNDHSSSNVIINDGANNSYDAGPSTACMASSSSLLGS